MKRYRLLKDLPTFKAGDIFEIRGDGCLYWDKSNQKEITLEYPTHWQPEVRAYHRRTLERFPNILEDWFEEVKSNIYYFIDIHGQVKQVEYLGFDWQDKMRMIGNWFKTKEEAELAVRKLKAFKRLKDKGFRFCCDIKYESLCGNGFNIPLNAIMPPEAYTDTGVSEDLNLLFCSEDD